MSYDGNGNPQTVDGYQAFFDPENRLTGDGPLFSFGYNGDNLRAWKQYPIPQTTDRTYFYYDGTLPVLEVDGNTGQVSAVNTFGANGLLSSRSGTSSVYYQFSPQGGVTQRLDGSGSMLATSVFDA